MKVYVSRRMHWGRGALRDGSVVSFATRPDSIGCAVVVGCVDARFVCRPSEPNCWLVANVCV
eukprot:2105073-Pyramimonas_sp.AAC.1